MSEQNEIEDAPVIDEDYESEYDDDSEYDDSDDSDDD